MLRAGVTGGIGSGKTIVCNIFSHLGVPVYNADLRAKWLVNNDSLLKESIVLHFGKEAYINGLYNPSFISKIVFKDSERLAVLNNLIHPAVFKDWETFCANHREHPIVIKEAAIMLETESRHTVDKIILVSAPENLRIQRVMQRDNTTEDAVRLKLNAQMPEEDKLKLADYVIVNDGEQSLIEQVRVLHQALTSIL